MILSDKWILGIGIFAKGGGGGGSGAVDYPDYMEAWHGQALNNTGGDALSNSVTDAINAAYGSSPWTTAAAYDPDLDLVELIGAPNELQTLVTLLSNGTTLDTLITNILDDSRIDDVVDEFAADMDARMVSDILPRFEAGMLNINAVQSSAFVIGRALIEQNQDRQVAKFSSELHLKAASDDAIKVIGMKLEYQKVASQLIAEAYRIKIVAKKEEADMNMEVDMKDALWDLELFQYGANLLAGIGGGSVGTKGPSTAQSAIGGAMSGAAAGATVGGPAGAVVGGILGAASAFL